jgi:hypothetical protein
MGNFVVVCGSKSSSRPWYKPLKEPRKSIAEAGKFMTKWDIVCGMVRILGSGTGSEALALYTRFAGIETVFWWVEVRCKMESAAWWMKVWPSWLNGRTKCLTWKGLVIYLRCGNVLPDGRNLGIIRMFKCWHCLSALHN